MSGITLLDLLTAYRGISRLKAVTVDLETLSVEASRQDGIVYILEDARQVSNAMEKFLALVEELVDIEALSAKGNKNQISGSAAVLRERRGCR